MKTIFDSRRCHYLTRVSIFLIIAVLIAGMVGCGPYPYSLTISSTEGGEVTAPGEGRFSYSEVTEVTIVADAYEGHRFIAWTGDADTIDDVNAAVTTITMNGDYSITGNFEGVDPGTLFAGGNGTEENPYQIANWSHLNNVRDYLDDHFILINDLRVTTAGYAKWASPTAKEGKGWEPIGLLGGTTSFAGTFDGQQHEIRDLFVSRPDQIRIGLFGMIDFGAVVKNLGVVNVTVIGGNLVGGLVGLNYGTISNSCSTGSVTGNDGIGGLVGWHSWGDLHDCYSIAIVTGKNDVGGLVGRNEATTVDYSYLKGTISNSYSRGDVTGQSSVGGLIGAIEHAIMVEASYSGRSVTGSNNVGGLVAFDEFDIVSNSYSSASVIGSSSVGGLVGHNYDGTVSKSYSTGNVTGDEYVGGLVGQNDAGSVSNSYSIGSVTGNDEVGGLVGYAYYGSVNNSFWDMQTSGQSSSDGGTGKTTAQMKSIATFSGAGWNIIEVALNQTNPAYTWNIVNGVNYPFLSWQPVS
jgi:hypothetical protein